MTDYEKAILAIQMSQANYLHIIAYGVAPTAKNDIAATSRQLARALEGLPEVRGFLRELTSP